MIPHLISFYSFFLKYLFTFWPCPVGCRIFGGIQDLISSTGDPAHAPCSGSSESELLEHQGSPFFWLFLAHSTHLRCRGLPLLLNPPGTLLPQDLCTSRSFLAKPFLQSTAQLSPSPPFTSLLSCVFLDELL